MSHQPSLKASASSMHLEARGRRVSKGVLKSPAAISADVSGEHEGLIKQSIRHLTTFATTRKKAAVYALVMVGALSWFMAPFAKGVTLGDLLNEEGYWEIVPPAESYVPGTINSIEVRSDGRIDIHPTCKIDSELLSKLTQQSRTLDRTLADRLSKKFVIVNRIEELLPIDVEGGKAKSLALSLQNSTILQITDEELLQVQRQVVQGDCREAIEQNISNGATVCQTREAIKGDLVYEVTYEEHGSVHVKNPSSLELKLEPKREDADRVTGRGLIYGVKFAPYGIVLNTPDAKPADCRVPFRRT
jgi:hypothetical protein